MDAQGQLGRPTEHGLLTAHAEGGRGFEPGYSGAPILDDATAALLGMVARTTSDKRTALILPIQDLERAWPSLATPTPTADTAPQSAPEPAAAQAAPQPTPVETVTKASTAPPPPESPHTPPGARPLRPPVPETVEPRTQFVPDDAEIECDELGRGVLAVAFARRLHKIWCSLNDALPAPPLPAPAASAIDSATWTGGSGESFIDRQRDHTRAAFVMHVDAPWGGGKTTFANFLARVLNPYGFPHTEGSFLRLRYGDPRTTNIGAIFLHDPPATPQPRGAVTAGAASAPAPTHAAETDPEDARRPWIIVPFNAWQSEHVSPPWWTFYQAIREGCFRSIWYEGRRPVDPNAASPPSRAPFPERAGQWAMLRAHEYLWRFTNPKVGTLLATAAINVVILVILHWLDLVTLVGKTGEQKAGFNVADGAGFILAGLTTIGAIWAIGSVITESLAPGTNTLAERLSLGSSDPFERFRQHFFRTIARVKRPVLVIVDDLDRCKPEFVVDLLRGIQTLLRSPRIAFIILGDRDWIERAFETYHAAMSRVSVGPEQTFGARFVEKTIQTSFVLPDMESDRKEDYVRRLLLGPQAARTATAATATIAPETAAVLRGKIEEMEKQQPEAPLTAEQVKQELKNALPSIAPALALGGEAAADERLKHFVNSELAIRAAVDERVEREISHRLEPLSALLPSNPRQIKRIINAVTMYHAVALQEGLASSDPLWFQLALWIIIMAEWPETWRMLASYPDLAAAWQPGDPPEPGQKLAALPSTSLPGSVKASLKEIKRITADANLMALLHGGNEPTSALTPDAIRALIRFTPLHSRKARLKEANGNAAGGGSTDAASSAA